MHENARALNVNHRFLFEFNKFNFILCKTSQETLARINSFLALWKNHIPRSSKLTFKVSLRSTSACSFEAEEKLYSNADFSKLLGAVGAQ